MPGARVNAASECRGGGGTGGGTLRQTGPDAALDGSAEDLALGRGHERHGVGPVVAVSRAEHAEQDLAADPA